MTEPGRELTRSDKPTVLADFLDRYRNTPLIGVENNLHFVGRIVIDVFEGSTVFPSGVDFALTWLLPPDKDAGLVFRCAAARLDQAGKQLAGARPNLA